MFQAALYIETHSLMHQNEFHAASVALSRAADKRKSLINKPVYCHRLNDYYKCWLALDRHVTIGIIPGILARYEIGDDISTPASNKRVFQHKAAARPVSVTKTHHLMNVENAIARLVNYWIV